MFGGGRGSGCSWPRRLPMLHNSISYNIMLYHVTLCYTCYIISYIYIYTYMCVYIYTSLSLYIYASGVLSSLIIQVLVTVSAQVSLQGPAP